MATHEEKRAEAQLHDSDFEFGEPLDIGQGYSVAFHSATCRYCKILANPLVYLTPQQISSK